MGLVKILLGLMSIGSKSKKNSMKGVTRNQSGDLLNCIFCDVINKKAPGKIEYENESISIFRTIAPYTKNHFLCCPKQHIDNVNSIEDYKIIEELVNEAIIFTKTNNYHYSNSDSNDDDDSPLLCFHIPPFNSIDHVHLHVLCEPKTLSLFGKIKYCTGTFYCKSAEEVIQQIKEKMMSEKNININTINQGKMENNKSKL